MNLNEQINQDFIEAMKLKEVLILSTLRMLKSTIKNREIEAGHVLSDQETGEVVAKSVKQRRESIVEYQKGNRQDLVKKEESEIRILEKYLPKQMDEAEILKIVEKAIQSINASGLTDTGKVMGVIMPKLKGKADGSLVSKLVKEKLG